MLVRNQAYLLFWVLLYILSPIHGQHECGKVRESQLYNGEEITEADEYTWIGRVGHRESSNAYPEFKCLSVLVNRRFAILPAHCVIEPGSIEPTFILFGVWRVNEGTDLGVCRPDGNKQCSPAPQMVNIEELVVHPRHRRSPAPGFLQYDIALAKLEQGVELTDFVQPICLPPANGVEDNYVAQRLEMAGFKIPSSPEWRLQEDDYWRHKVSVHSASLQFCSSKNMIRVQLSENNMCAVRKKEDNFFPGSPLMGFEMVDGKPRNSYVIGISIGIISLPDADRDTFAVLRILPFRNWILKNIQAGLAAE
uniref:Urokinase-type plasminogen activator-like n=1 Tax=Drosophila rhopaloa TaxID=1041015 RepID=A0A6P4FHK8_DRORH